VSSKTTRFHSHYTQHNTGPTVEQLTDKQACDGVVTRVHSSKTNSSPSGMWGREQW